MSAPIRLFSLSGDLDSIHGEGRGTEFDRDVYSRLKHGDLTALGLYGSMLAEELLAVRADLATTDAEVLLPVAYKSVPPGCFFLAHAVASALTTARSAHDRSPAQVTKIEKDSVTTLDYAASGQAEREAEMATIAFALAEPVQDAVVVLVDDVRVTGLAEATAVRAIEAGAPREVILAYVAVVEGALRERPEVEAVLNHATVQSVLDMLPVIEHDDFALTIRFLKRALKSEPGVLAEFAAAAPDSLLRQMLYGATETGPEFVDTYRGALDVIEREVATHV